MRVFEYQLVTDESMSASINSASQQLIQEVVCCVQAVFTGTPNGALKLQISNDDTHWSDYTGSEVAIVAAGNVAWNISNIGFRYIRVVYTRTSSTGVLNVTVSGKGV